MYQYSKTTNSFYPNDFLESYSDLPSDLVEVDEKTFNEFSGQPPSGKMRGSNEKCYPAWVDLPPIEPPTKAQLEANARSVRDDFLSKTDRMTVVDYTIADHRLTETEREELIQVRDEFRRWPQSDTFPNLEKMPDMNYWLFFEAVYLGWNAPDELKVLYGYL